MSKATSFSAEEALILITFADFGVDRVPAYMHHCRIKVPEGMTVPDAILAHYRTPLGYDIERAAMDLRTWQPIADTIHHWQMAEAERRAKQKAQRVRNRRATNGHTAELSI